MDILRWKLNISEEEAKDLTYFTRSQIPPVLIENEDGSVDVIDYQRPSIVELMKQIEMQKCSPELFKAVYDKYCDEKK